MPVTTRSKRKHQQAELEEELRNAVRRRDMARVRELLELERVDVDCVDPRGGYGPLFCAYTMPQMDLEIARFLLEKGANPNARGVGGNIVLAFSVLQAATRSIELLLEYGADLEAKVDGTTSLGFAIVGNRSEAVSALLRLGANTEEVRSVDDRGGTRTSIGALHLACRSQKIEIVKLLLDHGVEVNVLAQVETGTPFDPLCEACLQGNVEIAKLLLERGANPLFCGDAQDLCPPLLAAIKHGSLRLIQLLLEKITQGGNNSVGDESRSEIAGYLGGSALLFAFNKQNLEAAQLLVDFGANVNSKLLLLMCASRGQVENARFLLRAGANVNQSNAYGETPLFVAASRGHARVVVELLRARADVRMCNSQGETALGVAYRAGHMDIVYLLLRTSPHVWPRLASALL